MYIFEESQKNHMAQELEYSVMVIQEHDCLRAFKTVKLFLIYGLEKDVRM